MMLEPIGRLVGWAAVGVEPSIMGIGPAPASRSVLERSRERLAKEERMVAAVRQGKTTIELLGLDAKFPSPEG